MGIFDRDNPTATIDRPRTDPSKSDPSIGQPGSSHTSPGGSRTGSSPASHANSAPASSAGPARGQQTLRIRWTNSDGDVIGECTQTLAASGRGMGTLHVANPDGWTSGRYTMEILLNDACVAKMEHEVR
jgi:hypothetical protein